MIYEIPQYGLRAYSLFFSKHGVREHFRQSELDWIVSPIMKKKIFSLLLRNGWIKKEPKNSYTCINPASIINGLTEFKVPELIKGAKREYSFAGLSAVEIWSDYSYVQRGIEKSPYFIKILKKDIAYWKQFFNRRNIPNYINSGSTIGEYVILIPSGKITSVSKGNYSVEPLKEVLKFAKSNEMFEYAYNYMRKKYAAA
ncbi:MAG: hypothetical protein KKC54_04310 [Nanoarchaeota archaeon]|nr:hypothetical protein [Nanoarchaeota archaeon]